jgi:hypothetical protein
VFFEVEAVVGQFVEGQRSRGAEQRGALRREFFRLGHRPFANKAAA